MADLKHGFAHVNGVRLHYVEQGSGPLVLLCHGWPESWYSWRHQIPVLAAAGYRVVAPDQRGYGRSDSPEAISAYSIFNLVGDMAGLAKALGASDAVVVGHDCGAIVAQQCALLRPDLFRALVLLSVPYIPRKPIRPAAAYHLATQQVHFYQEYFQEPGRVERELAEEVRGALLGLYYSASGDAPVNDFAGRFPKQLRFVDAMLAARPQKLPAWLTDADLDFYAAEFTRAGFRGGINWYRNFDANWAATPFLDGARILQPTLYVAGDRDLVLKLVPDDVKAMAVNVPNLKGQHVLPGCGHWTQQERADEVNKLTLEFLRSL
ncbi:MAG: alpha/beta fold hydrolase [Stellaceae bacterium]